VGPWFGVLLHGQGTLALVLGTEGAGESEGTDQAGLQGEGEAGFLSSGGSEGAA